MPYYVNRIQNGTELYHHDILGQKCGVRRFQNKDGSLTRAGEKRYSDKEAKKAARAERREAKRQIKRDYKEANRLNARIRNSLNDSYDLNKKHDLKADRAEYNKALKDAKEFVKTHPQYAMSKKTFTVDGSIESSNGETSDWFTDVDAMGISAVKGTDAYKYGERRSYAALAVVGGATLAFVAASMQYDDSKKRDNRGAVI